MRGVEHRLYQERILETARRRNTLVVLPTALGKTVIALLLAVEKAGDGKVFFLAPTRPLAEQHHRTFQQKTLIEEGDLVLITGETTSTSRTALYRSGKMVFATPQCVRNDLKNGVLSLEDASLIIFDEAHRAVGDYAYVSVASYYRWQCPKPLVLGLTASPGGDEERLVEVCKNLGIEAIEHRTEEDEDVKPYLQPIEMEWRRVRLPEPYLQVREKLRETIAKRVRGLQSYGLLRERQPALVTRRDLVELNEELQRRLSNGEGGYFYQLKIQTTAALSVMHMIELIETQGPETLEAFIEHSLSNMANTGSRGHRSLLNDPLFGQMRECLAACSRVENPKLHELTRFLEEQMQVEAEPRGIVFTQYRDTVKAVLETVGRVAGVRPARFVGQGFKEGDPGMTQAEQREALERLRSGELNLLVATSIAEEGLDVPEVDYVVFYEPVPSEIRYIQRRGRTGRRVAGKVTILIAEDTLDEVFYWSSIRRARKMKKLIEGLNRKLPQMTRQQAGPSLTSFLAPKIERKTEPRMAQSMAVRDSPRIEVVTARRKLWSPHALETKGVSRAMKWLLRNLPAELTPVSELVQTGVKETGLGKAVLETAIWRLEQRGLLYQPEPERVKKP